MHLDLYEDACNYNKWFEDQYEKIILDNIKNIQLESLDISQNFDLNEGDDLEKYQDLRLSPYDVMK